eukprot:366923_1
MMAPTFMKCVMFNGVVTILFSLLLLTTYTTMHHNSREIVETQTISSGSKSLNYQECTMIIDDASIQFMKGTNMTSMYTTNVQLNHPYPIYLYSYGGSGNTLTRLLLEYITNIYTGSRYYDPDLLHTGFQGDAHVCTHVMFIKHHPENKFEKITKKKLRHICHKRSKFGYQDVHWSNMSATFIVRNPWKAIFSMYQFKFGDEVGTTVNEHTRHVMKHNWNATHFANYVEIGFDKFLKTFELMAMYQKYHYDYIVVKYENIINLGQPLIALKEMNKILRFAYAQEYYQQIKNMLELKMQCIFHLLMKNDYQRFGKVHRKPANESVHVTFDFAYQYMIDNHLDVLCDLWKQIEYQMKIFQYRNFNVNCAA